MKKLPRGMQDFKEIVTKNYVYVDKTRYFWEMLDRGKSYFLSRPRRFGKTLMISTLYYLFKGEKELFKDTYIYDQWDFKEYPVVRISMTEIDCESTETVKNTLRYKLEEIYREYGLTPHTDNYKVMFSDLVKMLSQRGEVVVLIDEYDRPMLSHLGDIETANVIRAVMREFYIVIKDTEPLLRLALLTGLTKITKVGIFSTLNHLTELSNQKDYAAMLGCTTEELEYYFADHIQEGARRLHISREELLEQIRDHYDGFSFDGEHFVYNPFSLLGFFDEYELKNFWVSSGLPSSLAEYVKKHDLKPEDYIHSYITDEELTAYEIEQAPPQNYLTQSGYLTFKGRDKYLGYLLDYPNREVRDSFSALMLISSFNVAIQERSMMRRDIIMGLRQRDFEPVFKAMNRTLANIPGKLYDNEYPKKEAYYHTVLLTLLWACELHVHAEEWTSRGISDLVLNFEGDIYVIELKVGSVKTALQQIKDRGYAEKYAAAPYLAMIGIEIDTEKRNLKEYGLELAVCRQ